MKYKNATLNVQFAQNIMNNNRYFKLVNNILEHSIDIQEGDRVLIDIIGNPLELVTELIRQIYIKKAYPYIHIQNYELNAILFENITKQQFEDISDFEIYRIKKIDSYISIREIENPNDWSNIPKGKLNLFQELYMKPVHYQERMNNTNWLSIHYPTVSKACYANLSTNAMIEYFLEVTSLNYKELSKRMDPLKETLEKGNKVEIKGNNVDLKFDITNIPVIKSDGKNNLPDGEVFTAPTKYSVNGYIEINTPVTYQGVFYGNNIVLYFRNGQVVDFKNVVNPSSFERLLAVDAGSNFIGEFGIGCNNKIDRFMNDTMFDEKKIGTFHIALGNCYKKTNNNNNSSIHLDLIHDMKKNNTDILIDSVTIIQKGIFLNELNKLN